MKNLITYRNFKTLKNHMPLDMLLNRHYHIILLIPAVLFLSLLFAYPLVRIAVMSFFDPGFTLQHYVRALTTPIYTRTIFNTFFISITVTIITLLLGYPVAYLLTEVRERTRNILLLFVLLPFWVSILVRTFSWIVLLQRHGVINTILMDLGIINSPLSLMYTRFSVIIGMIHILLPLMILPLYGVMKSIDKSFMKAAYSLGASTYRTFISVFFPLSLPGVAAGSLLVFILSIGFFITPALLGSPQDMMISMLIDIQVRQFLNWGFASALAMILLVATVAIFLVYRRVLGIERMFGG